MRITFIAVLLSIAASASAQLTVPYGGTGALWLNPYAIIAGGVNSTSQTQQLATGTTGQLLISGGSLALPSWTSVLAPANGGTGKTSLNALADSIGPRIIAAGAVVPAVIQVDSGGTGATTLTGLLHGNGTSAVTGAAASLTADVTGTLPIANGGTNATTFSAAQTNLGWKSVKLTSDTATTGQAALYTPLQFTIGATDVWDFDIYLNPTNNGTNGTKVAILLPASASVTAYCFGNVATIAAFTTDIISASATLGANFNTSTATADVIWIHGTVTGGGTGGAVVVGFAATTSGTATIKAGSYIRAHRIS